MSYAVETVADSWEFLSKLSDKSVDVVITDPPFPENVQANMLSGSKIKRFAEAGGGGAVPRRELDFPPLPPPDPVHGYTWSRDFVRVARRWVVIKCAVESFGEFKRAAPEAFVRGGLWHRPNAMGQVTKDRPAAMCEGLAIMHDTPVRKRWNGGGSYNIWSCNSTRGEGKRGEPERHPNQMPLPLCLKLVALFSEPGETILDPFCGSGRIGEAAVMLGRNYIGLDASVKWVRIAFARIEAAAKLGTYPDADALELCKARRADAEDDG